MYIKKENLNVVTEENENGISTLFINDLADFESRNPKLRTFALAKLIPGEEVAFHIHEGESESYYIISGSALYNDNGTEVKLGAGDATFTPSGTGHGIKNIGMETLEFIALIILD